MCCALCLEFLPPHLCMAAFICPCPSLEEKPWEVVCPVSFLSFFFFFVFFLGLHPQHMEVPRLEVKWEPQLLPYTTASPDPSHVCDLHHSSQQH